jgi:tripartite-type tricarboxylate transporter receptor subunit TctC
MNVKVVEARQHQIAEHEVRMPLAEQPERQGGIGGLDDVDADGFQHPAEGVTAVGVVLDDEDSDALEAREGRGADESATRTRRCSSPHDAIRRLRRAVSFHHRPGRAGMRAAARAPTTRCARRTGWDRVPAAMSGRPRRLARPGWLALAWLAVAPVGAAGAAAGAVAVPAYDSDAVAAHYRGKTVRIVVGFAAGGGFDIYSRVIARHLGRHLPGRPTVIVENMPGAGSIVAANHLYTAAPRDGTVIGNLSGPIVLEQMFGSPGVRFDLARLRHLGAPASDTFLMIATRKSGVARFDDLLTPGRAPLAVGVVPGSTIAHTGVLVREALGARLKIVSGYKGTAEVRMAIESGEVEASFISWTSVRVTSLDKLRSGEWTILAQLTDEPLDDLPVPGVPTILDLTADPERRRLLRLGTTVPNLFGKLYVLPPGVPPDRAAAVEAAFAKTFADAAFLADAEQARLEIRPLSGEAVLRLVREFLDMPADLSAKLRTLTRDPGR